MADRDLIIGGIHPVTLMLERAPQTALEIFAHRSGNSAQQSILQAARQAGVTVQLCERDLLDRRYGDPHHQGIVARRRLPKSYGETDLANLVHQGRKPAVVLVLDQVQDPRNFGACLRIADGVGATAVVVTGRNSAPLSAAAAKAASGAIDTVPLVIVANLARALARLKDEGLWAVGLSQDAQGDLSTTDLSFPAALVLGGEGGGLRRLTRERCDLLAKIPMQGALSSLNVATAAAVGLYEIRRQQG
ncbi:MAG: 23S rRNA (guanosine(2251)-2'-O)-methyltransferase RlmB [Pseudomonadota bacterium]